MSPDSLVAHHGEFAEDHSHEPNNVFGFWLYLMTDCILFATLFAGFAVSRHQYAGDVSGRDIFDLKYVGVETALLLVSSSTYGFAMIGAYQHKLNQVLVWLGITFLLGAGFVGMEINEFHHLVAEGHGPDRSAFLSAFFTLVGTHGLHVTCGLLWMLVLVVQLTVLRKPLDTRYVNRLMCLSLFWHFLDIVWICVFSLVYLMSPLMDHPALHGHSHKTHIEGSGGAGHAGYGAYGVGFALSVILTLAAFYPIMVPGTLPAGWIVPLVATLAVVQIFVHLVCFLHMSAGSEQRWNVTAFGFALLVVFILIGGSLWIMRSMSMGMADPDVPAVATQGHSDKMGNMNGM